MKEEIQRIIDDLETKRNYFKQLKRDNAGDVNTMTNFYYFTGKVETYDYAIQRLKELL